MQVVKGILGGKYQNWKRVKASDKQKIPEKKYFFGQYYFFLPFFLFPF